MADTGVTSHRSQLSFSAIFWQGTGILFALIITQPRRPNPVLFVTSLFSTNQPTNQQRNMKPKCFPVCMYIVKLLLDDRYSIHIKPDNHGCHFDNFELPCRWTSRSPEEERRLVEALQRGIKISRELR